MIEARAYWATAPFRGEIRAEKLAQRRPDEVLVQASFSGISRGTEALVTRGEVPRTQWSRMRCPFQAGAFPFPVKYGYASVGRVIEGAAELLGREVFCLHPHQSHYVVPASAVLPLPKGLPASRAILAANMETALNGLWDSKASAGDRITVVGAGVVGLLVAFLASRLPGAEVSVLDIDETRLASAEALGVCGTPTDGADIVFNCSGSGAGLTRALSLAGEETRVVEMSWHGTNPITLPLGEAFHSRRLTLVSSQVGNLPPERRPRWNYRRRLAKALELLLDPRLDVLVPDECSLDDLPRILPALARGEATALCQRVRYT